MRHINTFVRSFLTAHQVTITSIYPRIIGVLIIFKIIMPLLILFLVVVGGWQTYSEISKEVSRVNSALQPKVALAKNEIAKAREDIQNLSEELTRIKGEVKEAGQEIKRAIKPIQTSLNKIKEAGDTISSSVENTINKVTQAKVMKILKLKPLKLPDFDIVNIPIPKLNIDPNLNIDLRALQSLKTIASEVVSEAETSLYAIVEVWDTWVWVVKVIFYLLVFWFLLLFVGIAARAGGKLRLGFLLVSGKESKASLQML